MKIAAGDRSGVRVFPPLVFVLAGVVALVVHRFFPLHIAPVARAAPWRLAGKVLAVAAISLAISAVTTFRRLGTTANPAGGTTALASEGPYRFSRNPMYLGLVMLTTGVALVSNSLWPLLFLPVVVLVILSKVIGPEERYLEAKFGQPYRDYKARVRRWL